MAIMVIAAGFYQNAEGSQAEKDIVLATLRAFKQKGLNTLTLSEEIDIPGLSHGQVSGVVTAMSEQGLLKSSHVKRGYFSIQGFRISEDGEALINMADGLDAKAADKADIMKILQAAAKEEKPCLVDMLDIQQERASKLISFLVGEQLLETASVQRGFFSIQGVQITDHGKAALDAHKNKIQPRTDDLQAKI